VNALRHSYAVARKVTLIAALTATFALLIVSAIQPPLGLRLLARPSPDSANVGQLDSRDTGIDTVSIERWARRMHTSDVYLQWSGYVYAPIAAEYSFRQVALGKAELWIDNRPLLRTNGGDAVVSESTTHLSEGPHQIDVQYSQAGRPPNFQVYWKAGSAPRLQALPAIALSPRRLSSSTWLVRKIVFRLTYAVCFWWTLLLIGAGWKLIRATIGIDHQASPGSYALTGLALALLVTGIWWGWPGDGWAPDEVTPAVVRDALDMKFSGGWHDKYPPVHYYLLAATYAPFLVADRRGLIAAWAPEGQNTLLLVGRLLSVAMALGCLDFVSRLGRRLFSPHIGLLSAFCCLTFLPFVHYGKVANLDVPYLFWFALSLLFWAELRTAGSLAAYIGFGVASVIAVCTKDQAYGLYVLPALSAVWSSVRTGRPLRMVAAALVGLLAFVLCFNLPFNFSGFVEHLHVLTGPASKDYRMFAATPSGAADLLRVTLGQLFFGLGVAGVVAVGVGLVSWCRRFKHSPWWLLLPVASYVLCFLLVVGYVYDRFLLPVFLILSIVGGVGVDRLFGSRGGGRYAKAIGMTLVGVLVWRAASIDALLVTDSRYTAERWLQSHVASGDMVASFGEMSYLPRLSQFDQMRLDGSRENTLQTLPRFIVVNTEWMKRYPKNSPRAEWLAWLESGLSPYREALRYKTRIGSSALRFDRTFTDLAESPFTNLDKANPQIVIFERSRE
jgi:hypothetical protein